mgnify:CR=1 FL=1
MAGWTYATLTTAIGNYTEVGTGVLTATITNQFIENGAIYITKNKLFNKTNCRVSGKIGVFEMSEDSSLQIDSTYDILFAEQILKMRNKK